jgi:hypothetical protein
MCNELGTGADSQLQKAKTIRAPLLENIMVE